MRDILLQGKLAMLQRLWGEPDPLALLRSVPGVSKVTAWKLCEEGTIITSEFGPFQGERIVRDAKECREHYLRLGEP